MSDKPVYVRIKRKSQTYFVFCDPTEDTSAYLKEQIACSLKDREDVLPQDMRIMIPNGGELDDSKPLGDNVKNECELHAVFSKGGVWEMVDIVSTEDEHMQE